MNASRLEQIHQCYNTDEDNRFVGLAPGILVSLSVTRWIGDTFAGRKGKAQGRKQGSIIRILRSAVRCIPIYTLLISVVGTLIES